MSQPAKPTTPVEPRHAASVLLLREQRGSIEVLLTRRHENLTFMGGMWVFPGGGLCPADTAAEAFATIPESAQLECHRLRDLDGNALPATACHGLAIAAVRETFEETGVLLATTAEGHHADNDVLTRMQERRHAILSQPERFATSLQEEHLQLDLRRLVYWAHWITPSVIAKRFDTRFYLARLPAGQVAVIDAVETTEMTWMTPAALIAAAHDGTMLISRPTLYNLMDLDASVRQHISLNAILSAEARRDVVPVLPKITKGEPRMIVMPWDNEYPMLIGSGVTPLTYPERLLSLPSRAPMER
ncbi:NUDIX hydrolase [Steroidobacter sp.]|uniref:NUDIX hydrolase n=1 Tax=Steroidobacter sp. TaxID=1978227 RepID=UPI001A3F9353|nr:NUDIX hydrolase [Steroidobacter sp.]MBL8269658.1 NUDIX hydrolase [Steroidobacter sp.]